MEKLLVWGMIGLLAQLVDGALGMGYGVFSSTLVITAGVLPVIASASIHTAEIATTLISGGSHLFFGNVKKDWLLPLTIPGVIGGASGAYFLSSVPGDAVKPFVAGLLFILGVVILYRFISSVLRHVPALNTQSDGADPPDEQSTLLSSPIKLPILGFVAAFVDAVGGGGWGPITTPGLILTGNTEPSKVVGTVNLAEFFITLGISLTFILIVGGQSFDWSLIGALLAGGVVAAPFAAYICKKLPIKVLGILIGLLIIGTNLRTILIAIF